MNNENPATYEVRAKLSRKNLKRFERIQEYHNLKNKADTIRKLIKVEYDKLVEEGKIAPIDPKQK